MAHRCTMCALTVLATGAAHAAILHVSPNPRAPGFHTIAACLAAAHPGDTCRLAPGRYPEAVSPPSGTRLIGTSTSVIDGTDPLTGWTAQGNNVWTIPYKKPPAVPAVQIFIDGTPATQARWPNAPADPLRPAWSTMQAGSTARTIIDPALPAGNWVGATVHIFGGTDPYSHLTARVTNSAPGQLGLSAIAANPCPVFCAAPGSLYYIFGVPAAFDAPNEWLLAGGTLTLRMPSGESPEGHVRAKSRAQPRFWARSPALAFSPARGRSCGRRCGPVRLPASPGRR